MRPGVRGLLVLIIGRWPSARVGSVAKGVVRDLLKGSISFDRGKKVGPRVERGLNKHKFLEINLGQGPPRQGSMGAKYKNQGEFYSR